jgi:hypothetical protein
MTRHEQGLAVAGVWGRAGGDPVITRVVHTSINLYYIYHRL